MHRPESTSSTLRQGGRPCASHRVCASFLVTCVLATIVRSSSQQVNHVDEVDYGNHNLEWEDGPSSWEEFGHDNDPSVCGLQVLTVEEWEAGRYWEGKKPVLVSGVTEGWPALNNWKK
jgi:hypothetical protein